MKYHETVPSELGRYWTRYGIQHMTSTTGVFTVPPDDFMLGPLPTTPGAAISLACEIAFTRLWRAVQHGEPDNLDAHADAIHRLYNEAEDGAWSIELLRDLERVTRELGGGE